LALFSSVTMDDRYVEVEPYEEIVDEIKSTELRCTPIVGVDRPAQCPSRSLPTAQLSSQGPSTSARPEISDVIFHDFFALKYFMKYL